MVALVLCCGSFHIPWSQAATQAEVDAAWVRGLAWLLTHQRADGSWGTVHGTEVAATATAVEVLHRLGLRNHVSLFGVAWLANVEPGSVDSLARKIIALRTAGHDVARERARLLELRSPAGGWGAYQGCEPSFPDTALAAQAIAETDGPGVCNILYAQKRSASDPTINGSWGYTDLEVALHPERLAAMSTSGIVPSTANLLAVRKWMQATSLTCQRPNQAPVAYVKTEALDLGIAWLLGQRKYPDGGFGDDGGSTVFETGVVYTLLRLQRPNDGATGAALGYLLAHQDDWYRDAFHAATILLALPDPGSTLFVDTNSDSVPDTMIDTDGDGVPDAVEAYLQQSPSTPDSRWLANPYDGDLNQDGVVDAADVALADLIASGQLAATVVHLRHGDVAPPGAPDGVVDVADVIRIQGKALGLEAF
ncbi:MAG: prenyltransferase/squalene oxidase repeat-containing protein [Candidatus Methylomirabilota bacterium]